MGLVGTELVSVYISVCAALAVIHRRNHHRKLVKRSPTHLKPHILKALHTEPHPLKLSPTNLNPWPSRWLLSHNGARGLVIDVEVACSMSQNVHALLHYIPVASKHAAC